MKIFLRFVTLLLLFSLNFSNSNGQSLLGNKPTTTSEISTTVFFDNLSSEIIIRNFVEGKYLVQVFNLTGTEIIRHDSLKTNMARIPALNLRNGVYLVRITPTINQASTTFKIVVR